MNYDISFLNTIKQKGSIWAFIVFFSGELFSHFFIKDEVLNIIVIQIFSYKIDFGQIIMALLAVAMLIYLIVQYVYSLKKAFKQSIEENENLSEKVERLNQVVSKQTEALQEKHELDLDAENLFNLAMALDTFEPSKFILLEQALDKGHYYAGIYLANLYQSGLAKGKKTIISKDNQKAFEYYKKASQFDPTGIALWRMGWACERRQVERDKDNLFRDTKALEYYNQSKKFGYAKAYNSIGKFYNFGKGGLKRNPVEAIGYYRTAERLGDHYAVLNKAYILVEMGVFDEAVDSFKKAMTINSPLAYVRYADFICQHRAYFEDQYTDEDILEIYSDATRIENSNHAARAFIAMGHFVELHPDVGNINEISFKCFGEVKSHFSDSCYLKAFEMLDNNYLSGIELSPYDQKQYEILKQTIATASD